VVRLRHPKVHASLDLATYLAQEHIAVSSRRRGLSAEDFELGRHKSAPPHPIALPKLLRRLPRGE
jgi:hypothetical protein